MPAPPETLAARLRQARRRAGLNQDVLAGRSGVKLDTLRAIEQGRTRNPGIFTVLQIAVVLDVSLDSLIRPSAATPTRTPQTS